MEESKAGERRTNNSKILMEESKAGGRRTNNSKILMEESKAGESIFELFVLRSPAFDSSISIF
jgi:hypothetical protein